MWRARINYRYYNPQDGRWTRRDPIGIEGGINFYSYVKNGGAFKIDELGLNDNHTCTKGGEYFIVNKTFALSYGLFPVSPYDSEVISNAAQISERVYKFARKRVPVLRMTEAVFKSPELANELIKAAQKNKNSGRLVVHCKIDFIVCVKDCSGSFEKSTGNTGYVPSELVLPAQIEQGMYHSERNAEKVMKEEIKKLIK